MISRKEFAEAQQGALKFFGNAAIALTPKEQAGIEVADFGLGDLRQTGLEIVTYVNTERCCAKELVLFPGQTCPEHRHPAVAGEPGKEETFRCRWGTVYLYVPGAKTARPHAKPPAGREKHYTAWHEIVLKPGDQYTLVPNTLHWFQGGDEGAVLSEFSTKSRDGADIFTDPHIARMTKIGK
jgi:D-lyxose ketol-isomerase